MSTTRQLLEAYYGAFNAGDRERLLTLLTDDVVHDVNQGPREVGKEAFRAFLARMDASYQEQIAELVYLTSDDEGRAATEYLVLGKYLRTDEGLPEAKGQTYRLPGGAFFEIRSGKIARVTNYYNLEDWLRQVRSPGT